MKYKTKLQIMATLYYGAAMFFIFKLVDTLESTGWDFIIYAICGAGFLGLSFYATLQLLKNKD